MVTMFKVIYRRDIHNLPLVEPQLSKDDIVVPLLYKIYTYLRKFYRHGHNETPLSDYFNPRELKIMVDALINCQDIDFIKCFYNGSFYTGKIRFDRTTFANHKIYASSCISKVGFIVEKAFNWENVITSGELESLDYLFNIHYALRVFNPTTPENTSYYYNGLCEKFRPYKSLDCQLNEINNLFGGIGQRIHSRRNRLIRKICITNMTRTNVQGVKVNECVPIKEIIDFF